MPWFDGRPLIGMTMEAPSPGTMTEITTNVSTTNPMAAMMIAFLARGESLSPLSFSMDSQ